MYESKYIKTALEISVSVYNAVDIIHTLQASVQVGGQGSGAHKLNDDPNKYMQVATQNY